MKSNRPKSVPVMTRLAPTLLSVLDLVVEARIAKSRSDALAFCVSRFATTNAAWLADLGSALQYVRAARALRSSPTYEEPKSSELSKADRSQVD